MSEQQLRTLLESSASGLGTGPAPIAAIETLAIRRRTRRRGLAAAAIVAIVGSAITVAVVSGDDDGATLEPAANTEPLDLPTSQWRPGDDGMDAGIPGVLRLDENDCVYLGSTDPKVPRRQPVVWPADYSAALVEGDLVLYDADGEAVAVEGDELVMGGGYIPPQAQHRCSAGNEVAYVQSEVEVVGHHEATRTELELETSDWEEGDRGLQALIQGDLHVDLDGCVVLGDPYRGQAERVVWPKGFAAAVENDRLTLFDANGQPVARDGDTVSMGGGHLPAPASPRSLCSPVGGEVPYAQSTVSVVKSAE